MGNSACSTRLHQTNEVTKEPKEPGKDKNNLFMIENGILVIEEDDEPMGLLGNDHTGYAAGMSTCSMLLQ